jgi:hypothetical protein
MRRLRYPMKLLGAVLTLAAIASGALRWLYDSYIAEHQQQKAVAQEFEAAGVDVSWTYVGPHGWPLWKVCQGPAFWRPTHAYCDDVSDAHLAKLLPRLGKLSDLTTLVLLGRQIVPQAWAATNAADDPLIAALREHPSLQRLVVDASIRGTPAEFAEPIYTREDRVQLEATLPNVEIIWIEAN